MINILVFIFMQRWIVVNQLDIHIHEQAIHVNRYWITKSSTFCFPCNDIGMVISTC
jgi:hypothetical protein